MALSPGTRLGRYEVVSALGRGGMGEVYRARDTSLGREVAIKLLLEEVADDPERLARFEREARVLASLAHPNIATLHGFEREDGKSFLVMELVAGETLADRIARGPIPVDEAVALFVEIAEGLEAAHARGIVHRDLKPANIKVSPDGRVKILDFGLAKALAPDTAEQDLVVSQSPTLSLAATRRGEILGTAAYMSPEQASGKAVDRRTDVWAFGACLWEALTGHRPFEAEDAPNTLAAVLRDEPDESALPAETPPRVRRLLRRCLAKRPRERLHDIADARLVLADREGEAPASTAPASSPRRPLLVGAVLGGALALAAGALAWLLLPRATPPPPVPSLRLDVRIAEAVDGAVVNSVAMSPDGTRIAYVVISGGVQDSALYVRSLDQIEGTRLAEGAVFHPFFSPDGRWIGYVTERALCKVAVAGGTPTELATADQFTEGDWSEDDRIVFTQPTGLRLVSASGGEVAVLTENPFGGARQVSPRFLPSGRTVIFTELSAWQGLRDPSVQASVRAVDTESRSVSIVLARGAHARYAPTGHLLYLDGGQLFAVRFDPERLATTDTAVATSVSIYTVPLTTHPGYDLSRRGDLLYLPRVEDERSTAIWIDRDGRSTPALEPGFYGGPALSPDGTRLALTELRDGNVDVHVYDLGTGDRTRLTFDPGRDDDVLWSEDGAYVLFASRRDGRSVIYRIGAEGAGEVEPVHASEDERAEVYPSSFGPDGSLGYGIIRADSGEDVRVLPAGGGEPVVIADSPAREEGGVFSPDGRWIAYSKLEAGQWEVWAREYPPRAGVVQLSSGGGRLPRWKGDGSELYFETGTGIDAVPIEAGGGRLRKGSQRQLSRRDRVGTIVAGEGYPSFDVTADGERFLVIQTPPTVWGAEHVRLVTNWSAELERLAPVD